MKSFKTYKASLSRALNENTFSSCHKPMNNLAYQVRLSPWKLRQTT